MRAGGIPANEVLEEDQVSTILLENKLMSDMLCQSTGCRGRSKLNNKVEEIPCQPTAVEENGDTAWIP